jgi:hypothetical protein
MGRLAIEEWAGESSSGSDEAGSKSALECAGESTSDPMPFLAYLKFKKSAKFASFWSAISVGLSHVASSTSTILVGVTTTCM